MATSLVIHGHFYQPPRENPWTGSLERQPSAHPDHDWNERIYKECYRPNAFARIFGAFGMVERIVNNYAHLSFNIGPTLMSWIEEHHPVTYRRILQADADSARSLAERLRERLAITVFDPVGHISVSTGIAQAPAHAMNPRELAACAEAAMMTAKASGGARAVVCGEGSDERPAAASDGRDLRSIARRPHPIGACRSSPTKARRTAAARGTDRS